MPKLVAELVLGEIVRSDALCQRCWKPALVSAEVHSLTASGVSTLGCVSLCADCDA